MAGGVPAGLRRWLLSGWLRAGFDAFMTWAAIRQASGRKSSHFRPVSFRSLPLSLSGCPRVLLLALSVRSGRAGWRHRGGGRRRVRLAGVRGVSCSPTAWGRACRSRAVSVWPSLLLAVLGQSVRALGLALGMGGDPRPTGLLIGKMHKDSIINAA